MSRSTYPFSELFGSIQGGEHLAELRNFPLVNQRTSITFDNKPSENEDYNCVVANLVACIFFFHPEYIGKLSPDAAKDAVLGELYTGGMNIRNFIPWAKAHGVDIQAFTASHAAQVAEGHRQIQAGNPIIITGFDPYSSDPNNTHVYTWFKEEDGGLVALDPFGPRDGILLSGKSLNQSDAEWAGYLKAPECWIVTQGSSIDLTNPTVARYFSDLGNDVWKCSKNGFVVGHGILNFYRHFGGDGLNGLTYLGLPLSNEIPIAGHAGVVKQQFERAIVSWDPNHQVDSPPGAGQAYLMHLPQ
jgi:hypothetical protein